LNQSFSCALHSREPPGGPEAEAEALEMQTACRILPDANRPLFQVTFFLASYVVPLTLICGLYVCMLLRLWKGVRVSAESRRGRKRVTRLVLVVVGVFAICWCPIQVGSRALSPSSLFGSPPFPLTDIYAFCITRHPLFHASDTYIFRPPCSSLDTQHIAFDI
jgi:hypothetical protein